VTTQELFPPTLDDQIACVEREIKLRRRVYPRRIANGQMTQALADKQIMLMEAVADSLRWMKDHAR
jgi:hypothetical protein